MSRPTKLAVVARAVGAELERLAELGELAGAAAAEGARQAAADAKAALTAALANLPPPAPAPERLVTEWRAGTLERAQELLRCRPCGALVWSAPAKLAEHLRDVHAFVIGKVEASEYFEPPGKPERCGAPGKGALPSGR